MCRELHLCANLIFLAASPTGPPSQDANFTLPALDIHYWRECPMLSACQFCEQVPNSTNFEESNELHYDLYLYVYLSSILVFGIFWLYFCLCSERSSCFE